MNMPMKRRSMKVALLNLPTVLPIMVISHVHDPDPAPGLSRARHQHLDIVRLRFQVVRKGMNAPTCLLHALFLSGSSSIVS
jgi:hypothetical protein